MRAGVGAVCHNRDQGSDGTGRIHRQVRPAIGLAEQVGSQVRIRVERLTCRSEVRGVATSEYDFFVAPLAATATTRQVPGYAAASVLSQRLPRWVYVLGMGQGAFVLVSAVLAYSTLRSTSSDRQGVGVADRYVANYEGAVASHLALLIAVIALGGLTIAISSVVSRTEALGWAEGTLLVITVLTAFAPPTVPGSGWKPSPLGLPYGFGLTGLIAVAGALVVLLALARHSIAQKSVQHD